MPSKITTPVAFRIHRDILPVIKRRAVKRRMTISEYLRKFVEYDATRRR